MLRWCSNLHRGWRLLRRIAATRPTADLDRVVEETIVGADALNGRIGKLEKALEKSSDRLQRQLGARLGDVQRDIARSVAASEKEQGQQGERVLAQGASLAQGTEAVHRGIQTQVASLAEHIRSVDAQLSALRDYTAKQQEQTRRLQDGYDWSITKNLCRRIIQCIDGMDRRLQEMPEETDGRADLTMFRDDLVFTLDGSGIEQFVPDVDTEYKGLEASVEVMGTSPSSDVSLIGKISEVVCPGYRYFVDGDTVRLVRSAQVKIFTSVEGDHDNG